MKKNYEITPATNYYKIGEMLTVHTKVLKKKKYCSGYLVVENSQPDKLALFNVFTNELEFVKCSTKDDLITSNIIDESIKNNDNLKTYDIVVFKDTISRKRMKIFFVNKIHKDNTCDLIKVNCLGLTDESIILTLKNVNMNLLMHIEHAFRITHKNKYDNKIYTFQDYKFGLTNDLEKNIIVGTLEKEEQFEGNKNKNMICCSNTNSDINKERTLLNRCFIYLNDPSIVFKASSEHMKMIFKEIFPDSLDNTLVDDKD